MRGQRGRGRKQPTTQHFHKHFFLFFLFVFEIVESTTWGLPPVRRINTNGTNDTNDTNFVMVRPGTHFRTTQQDVGGIIENIDSRDFILVT